jgi:hypothetical protein
MDIQAVREALTAGGVRYFVRPGAKLTTHMVFMRKSLLLGLDEEVAAEKLAAEIGCELGELMRAASCGKVADFIVIDDIVVEKELTAAPREMDFILPEGMFTASYPVPANLTAEYLGRSLANLEAKILGGMADRDGDVLDPAGVSFGPPREYAVAALPLHGPSPLAKVCRDAWPLTEAERAFLHNAYRERSIQGLPANRDAIIKIFGGDGVVYTQDRQPTPLIFLPGTLEALKPVVVDRGNGWADVTLRFCLRAEVVGEPSPANYASNVAIRHDCRSVGFYCDEPTCPRYYGLNGPDAPKEECR